MTRYSYVVAIFFFALLAVGVGFEHVPRVAAATCSTITAGTWTGSTRCIISSSGTWTVPADWNSTNNHVYILGPGGNGHVGTLSTNAGGGGGGGAFVGKTNWSLTPGTTYAVAVGAGGSGQDTIITGNGNPTVSCASVPAPLLCAKAGASSTGTTGAPGGSSASSVSGGGAVYSGGAGAAAAGVSGGGGGGAGGVTANGNASPSNSGEGGASGSGAAGGKAAYTCTGTVNQCNNPDTGNPSDSCNDGGVYYSASSGPFGASTGDLDGDYGTEGGYSTSGGGGGGDGTNAPDGNFPNGCNGGSSGNVSGYGGGGGGGAGTAASAGAGGSGIIVVVYQERAILHVVTVMSGGTTPPSATTWNLANGSGLPAGASQTSGSGAASPGVSVTMNVNGTYNVTSTPVANYSPATYSGCSGTMSTAGATCTITYNYKPGLLIQAQYMGGTPGSSPTFTASGSGAPTPGSGSFGTSGTTITVTQGGSYNVIASNLPGFNSPVYTLNGTPTGTPNCSGIMQSAGATCLVTYNATGASAGTYPLTGYAWSSTAGWISMNCSNENTCAGQPNGHNYGVFVDDSSGTVTARPLTGYAWSSNLGWISFNSADVAGCPGGTCGPTLDQNAGKMSGWARVLAAKNDAAGAGGWDGFISLSCSNENACANTGGVDYGIVAGGTDGCHYTGYAWSGGSGLSISALGWLFFGNTGGHYGVLGHLDSSGGLGSCSQPPLPDLTSSISNTEWAKTKVTNNKTYQFYAIVTNIGTGATPNSGFPAVFQIKDSSNNISDYVAQPANSDAGNYSCTDPSTGNTTTCTAYTSAQGSPATCISQHPNLCSFGSQSGSYGIPSGTPTFPATLAACEKAPYPTCPTYTCTSTATYGSYTFCSAYTTTNYFYPYIPPLPAAGANASEEITSFPITLTPGTYSVRSCTNLDNQSTTAGSQYPVPADANGAFTEATASTHASPGNNCDATWRSFTVTAATGPPLAGGTNPNAFPPQSCQVAPPGYPPPPVCNDSSVPYPNTYNVVDWESSPGTSQYGQDYSACFPYGYYGQPPTFPNSNCPGWNNPITNYKWSDSLGNSCIKYHDSTGWHSGGGTDAVCDGFYSSSTNTGNYLTYYNGRIYTCNTAATYPNVAYPNNQVSDPSNPCYVDYTYSGASILSWQHAYVSRDSNGNIIKDSNGNPIAQCGTVVATLVLSNAQGEVATSTTAFALSGTTGALTLSASPNPVVKGSTTQLSWSTNPPGNGTTNCTITSSDLSDSNFPHAVPLGGTCTIPSGPYRTGRIWKKTTYTMTCFDGNGNATGSVNKVVTILPVFQFF